MNIPTKTDIAWRIVVKDIDGVLTEHRVERFKLTAEKILELDNGDECIMDVAWMQVVEWH